MFHSLSSARLPSADEALRGRDTLPFPVPERHEVLGNQIGRAHV